MNTKWMDTPQYEAVHNTEFEQWLDKLEQEKLLELDQHLKRNEKEHDMPNIDEMMPSKFLKKSDTTEAGKIVTVQSLSSTNVGSPDKPEDKWTMSFVELDKPLVMNKTNLKRAAVIFNSKQTEDWIGKKVNLYFDPMVEFAGEIKGGLRLKPAEQPAQPESENPAAGIDF